MAGTLTTLYTVR